MTRTGPGPIPLLAVQVAAEVLVLGADLALTGGAGLVMPVVAGAGVAGAYGYWLRRTGPVERRALRRLGAAVGLAHIPVGAAAYAVAWSQEPGLYDFGAAVLPLAAVCVGLLTGGLVFAGSSCALDLGVHAGGGIEDDVPRVRSFREPPG